MNLRTDLAAERILFDENKNLPGVSSQTFTDEKSRLEISKVKITDKNSAEKLGKPTGNYTTIKFLTPIEDFSPEFESRVEIIANEIKALAKGSKKILLAGLGNRKITPDALGWVFAENIFATSHIKMYGKSAGLDASSDISVITPGVMGQTGIESAVQVKAICNEINPGIVLATDALACSDIQNLGKVIQLCDTGISPGSGVANARKELSRSTLGVTCIALGIPTVMDLSTAVSQISGKFPETNTEMMITPRNIDKIVQMGGKYLAYGVNRAFLPELSVEELDTLID